MQIFHTVEVHFVLPQGPNSFPGTNERSLDSLISELHDNFHTVSNRFKWFSSVSQLSSTHFWLRRVNSRENSGKSVGMVWNWLMSRRNDSEIIMTKSTVNCLNKKGTGTKTFWSLTLSVSEEPAAMSAEVVWHDEHCALQNPNQPIRGHAHRKD